MHFSRDGMLSAAQCSCNVVQQTKSMAALNTFEKKQQGIPEKNTQRQHQYNSQQEIHNHNTTTLHSIQATTSQTQEEQTTKQEQSIELATPTPDYNNQAAT